MPIALAAIIPPITVVPITWRATEPAPDAVQSGTHPRMKAKEVIRIGRSRSFAPSNAASANGFPLSYSSFVKLHDQNRVFGRQTNQHHQADLGIYIALNLNHVCGLKLRDHYPPQPQDGKRAKY